MYLSSRLLRLYLLALSLIGLGPIGPQPACAQPATGLTGQYFNDIGGTAPYATRNDPTIDFDFVLTPAPGQLTANFSVRWVGKLTPRYSEKYLLMTYSVGGVRLTLNGQSLIDNWSAHTGAWNWQWIDLQAGSAYDIEVDYFAKQDGAAVQFWWQSPTQAKEIVPASCLSSTVTVPPAPKNLLCKYERQRR